MSKLRETALLGVVLLGLAIAVARLAGCAQPLTPQEKAGVAESTYAAEQVACVDSATTLEGAKACRAEKRAKWDAGTEAGK